MVSDAHLNTSAAPARLLLALCIAELTCLASPSTTKANQSPPCCQCRNWTESYFAPNRAPDIQTKNVMAVQPRRVQEMESLNAHMVRTMLERSCIATQKRRADYIFSFIYFTLFFGAAATSFTFIPQCCCWISEQCCTGSVQFSVLGSRYYFRLFWSGRRGPPEGRGPSHHRAQGCNDDN